MHACIVFELRCGMWSLRASRQRSRAEQSSSGRSGQHRAGAPRPTGPPAAPTVPSHPPFSFVCHTAARPPLRCAALRCSALLCPLPGLLRSFVRGATGQKFKTKQTNGAATTQQPQDKQGRTTAHKEDKAKMNGMVKERGRKDQSSTRFGLSSARLSPRLLRLRPPLPLPLPAIAGSCWPV
jgi:hypothetical protein